MIGLSVLAITIVAFVFISAYAEEPKEFGYVMMPEKIIEGTEGLLQIYTLQNGIPLPKIINNLAVTSSDSTIVKIGDIVTDSNNFVTSIKMIPLEAGTANIAIGATGYSSIEFSVTVYDAKQSQNQILVKAVPERFSVNGPSKGYFSVQLADSDGNPTVATKNIIINTSTSNQELLELTNSEFIIKKGEYFAMGEFIVKDYGQVTIHADSVDLESGSSVITIEEPTTNNIELFVMPNKISNFASSYTYAIVQLQDDGGNPIKATENIPLSLEIDRVDALADDDREPDIRLASPLMIPEGKTFGLAKLVVRAGVEETYDISVSTNDYLVSGSKRVETSFGAANDISYGFDSIPVLATGSEELIGILYPKNSDDVAVLTTKFLDVKIDSSNKETLATSDVIIKEGNGAVPIFADTGYVVDGNIEISILDDEKTIITPTVSGPTLDEIKLISEPLVSKILPMSKFPTALYMIDGNNDNWFFAKTNHPFVSPNDFVNIIPNTITEGDSIIILESTSLKDGKTSVDIEVDKFTSKLNIDTNISKPDTISLSYADPIISGIKNTVSLQILDSNQQPIYSNSDMEFKIVLDDSNAESLENTIIEKGNYHTLFDVIPNKSGDLKLSVLASDFSLSEFDIKVIDATPILEIRVPDTIEPESTFDATLSARILTEAISGANVEWKVEGAEIQNKEIITDDTGKAKLTLLATNPEKITIKGKVSGIGFGESSIDKEVMVFRPNSGNFDEQNILKTIQSNYVFVLLPVVIGIGILLKKKSLLEPLSERFPQIEKITSIIDNLGEKIPGMSKLSDTISGMFENLALGEKISDVKEKIPLIRER